MQGPCSISAHLWAPEKAGVRQPFLILSLSWGPPRMQGLCSTSAHLWGPEKVGVRQPILILSPCWCWLLQNIHQLFLETKHGSAWVERHWQQWLGIDSGVLCP